MKLKFWKKEKQEKKEPHIVEIPEENIEEVIKLFSIFNQEWDSYCLKFKDIMVEYSDFNASNYTNKALRYKRYLLWQRIIEICPEVYDPNKAYKLNSNDVFKPYFEEIL
jgi:hypothetical protein